MNQIKFRGKRKDNSKWVYGYLFRMNKQAFILGKECKIIQSGGKDAYINHFVEVTPETVGQFTGLYDKNGKEDYDGNIWEVEYRGVKHRFLRLVTMRWQGYTFDFRCLTGEVSPVHANVNEDGEIIGNVHDNLELMKGD